MLGKIRYYGIDTELYIDELFFKDGQLRIITKFHNNAEENLSGKYDVIAPDDSIITSGFITNYPLEKHKLNFITLNIKMNKNTDELLARDGWITMKST